MYISADSDFEGFSQTKRQKKKDRMKKAAVLAPVPSFPKLDVADSQGVKDGGSFSGTHAEKSGNSAFERKKGSGGEDLQGAVKA